MADVLLAVAVAVAMAAGIVGTIVPLLPGLLLVWAAGLVYGLVEGFGRAGVVAFALMTVLLVVGTVAKYVLPGRRGLAEGAARTSLLLAAVLGIVGFFVVPLVGLPLGAVLGIYLGELQRHRDRTTAWRTTLAVLKAFGVGVAVEAGCGLAMVACWLVWLAAS